MKRILILAVLISSVIITLAVNSLKLTVQKTSAAPPPIPNPMILAYGGYDKGFDPTMLNEEGSISTPNVVESRVKSSSSQVAKEGVKTLVEKGVLPAFHTTALPRTSHTYWWDELNCDELICEENSTYEKPNCNDNSKFKACIDYNVNLWQNAFTDELDGNLPGGYQALAVDEINMNDIASYGALIKHETLKKVKNNNPDRLIFVWLHPKRQKLDRQWLPFY